MKNDLFGKWLDLSMTEKGLLNRELAEKIGTHETSVSHWRSGRRQPPAHMCALLADIFDVDPLRLMVTAGIIPATDGARPLEPPQEPANRKALREQLQTMPEVSSAARASILAVYDAQARKASRQQYR